MTEPALMVDESTRPAKVANRVLLVHGNAPWQPNGGGVFLDQFAELSGARCDHLMVSLEGRRLDVPPSFERRCHQIVARQGVPGLGWLARRSPRRARELAASVGVPRLRAQLQALIPTLVAERFDHIVLFLNTIEVAQLSDPLTRALGVPYSTMEWDLLEHVISDIRPDSRLAAWVSGAALRLRRGAVSRGVASEGMADVYSREWGLDSVVLRQSVAAVPPRARGEASDAFVIVVSGNMYTPVEFAALLSALDRLDWAVNGRAVRIEVVGRMMIWDAPLPEGVRVTGWVTHERAQELVAGADLGYVGYWFAPESRRLVETCFPSKFIAYVGAGVPVFYHGPASGSPARFLEAHPAGFVCDSLDPAVIAERLVSVLGSPDALRRAREATRDAVAGEFGAHTLRERLRGFLTVPVP